MFMLWRSERRRSIVHNLVDIWLLFVQSVLNKVDTKHVWYHGSPERAMDRIDTEKLFIFCEYLFICIHTDMLSLLQASKMTYIVRKKTFFITDFCILNAFNK